MNKIKIGYDDNLGLPNDFADTIGCNLVAYHDIGKMIAALENQTLAAIFIHAGTLPYLKNCKIVAQSLYGPLGQLTLQSNFVSASSISISNINHLVLGRVNEYCTTSFWAPLIYLMKILPQHTTLTFKNTNGFKDMLHKTAGKKLDCSMVWDIILKQNPQDTAKVHELFHKNDLPTPIIVTQTDLPDDIRQKLINFRSTDHHSFFIGFQKPNLIAINQFIAAMQKTTNYFTVVVKEFVV